MAEAQISLAGQIKAVEREITMRGAVYPGRVSKNSMSQETADYEIAAMKSVLVTLRRFERYEKAFDALDQINKADAKGVEQSLFGEYDQKIETNHRG